MKLTIKLGLGGSKRKRRDGILSALLPALVPMFSSLLSSESRRPEWVPFVQGSPLVEGCTNCLCTSCMMARGMAPRAQDGD